MSDPAERTTEVEPLKGGQGDKVTSKGQGCSGKLGMSKLSGWRTAAFLLSLFLCLTVVFAFSFILPCPVRPQYQSTWNRTLTAAVTYNFLAVADANNDKVMDIFFVTKSAEGVDNHTCIGEGLPSPCLFLLAVEGTHGNTIWERPLAAEFHWAECGVEGVGNKGKSCLVAHADNLTAIDMQNGKVMWQKPHSLLISGKFPVIVLPDLNGDGFNDITMLSYTPADMVHTPLPTELVFFSGKSGDVIGSKVDVDLGQTFAHLHYTTSSGALYLLLCKDTGLYAVGLWRLAAKAQSGLDSKLKKDSNWEKRATDSTGLIPLYESTSLQRVLVVRGGSDSSPPLLLQTLSSVKLLNPHTLTITWSVNISSLLSDPSFGHYNKDQIPDIVLEEDLRNSSKKVVIVNGHSGHVLWEATLSSWSKSPSPASVLTVNSYSVFMLWGDTYSRSNGTSSNPEERSTFLLHPHYSNVLLERRNPAQQIISFRATLLERGRHACYLILTGADGHMTEEAGLSGAAPVVLTKRKIKDDVEESSMQRVDEASSKENENTVKEAFHRLRFSDETQ